MRDCILLYVYKDNREFNMKILKEVYKDAIVFCTDRILAIETSKVRLDEIFPAVNDFNTGQFMVVNYRLLDIIKFSIKNDLEILEMKFYNEVSEESENLINEILALLNDKDIHIAIKSKLLELLKEEIRRGDFMNEYETKSLKIKIGLSEIEFYNCTRLKIENILELDINTVKRILDSISD